MLLNYQTYVVNGVTLDFEFEQIAQTRSRARRVQVIEVELEPSHRDVRSGHQERQGVHRPRRPEPVLGHEIGASWYFGRYTPSFLPSENLWALAGDWKSVFGPFELEGEYVFTHFGGIRNVADRPGARRTRLRSPSSRPRTSNTEVEFELANLATEQAGLLARAALSLLARLPDQELPRLGVRRIRSSSPCCAASRCGSTDWSRRRRSAAAGSIHFDTEDRRVDRITAGLAYRPVPARRLPARLRVHADQSPARACRASPTSSPATWIT